MSALESPKMQKVAEFLKSPDAAGLSDAEVARRLGVGRATVYHVRQSEDDMPPNVRMVPTRDLIVDDRFQCRAGLDPATLGNYRRMFAEGRMPPNLVAFERPEGLVLVDGLHRHWAAQQEKVPTLPVEVRTGTEEDLFLYAAAANADHGVPRDDETVKNAIRMILENVAGARQWGAEKVADAARTTHYAARKVLRELKDEAQRFRPEIDGEPDRPDEVEVRRNGQVYKVDRNRINKGGRKKATPEPAAEAQDEAPATPESPEDKIDRQVQVILDLSGLYQRLAPPCKAIFREDVRIFVEEQEYLAGLRKRLGKVIDRRGKGEPTPHFASVLHAVASLPHPSGGLAPEGRTAERWLGCSDCLRDHVHTGTRPDGRNKCGSCSGRGYSIPGAR